MAIVRLIATLCLWCKEMFVRPACALLVFLVAQVVGGVFIAVAGGMLALGGGAQGVSVRLLACGLLLSSVLCCGVLLGVRQWGLLGALRGLGCGRRAACAGVLSFVSGMVGVSLLTELLQLPDATEGMFEGLSETWIGVLAVGICGPVAEELVFRGGVVGGFLRGGMRPWVAVGVGALVFGAVHFNWAQLPAGVCAGALLGIIYVRTRSLVIPCICHVLNNLSSLALMHFGGEDAARRSLSDMLGTGPSVCVALVALALCVGLLRFFCLTAPSSDENE